jgi:hypothetical protein
MTLTTSQAMAQFLTDISVTDYQKTSIIKARKDTAITNLTTAFPATSDLPFLRAVLMGSAAKGTIVRPIDDIDVLAVFSNDGGAWNRYRFDSQAFLYRIRKAYDGLSTVQVGARGQAVRLFFKGSGHVDIAPVFLYGNDVYALPNGTGGWLSTAPTVASSWFAAQNAALSYNLAPLVRLLKKWNQAHSKRLQSFHLETMAASTFGTLGSSRQSGLASFFDWAAGHIDIADPGGQSGLLSGYLSLNARQEVINSFRSAHERAVKARAAETLGNHAEAKRQWRIILGSAFPD